MKPSELKMLLAISLFTFFEGNLDAQSSKLKSGDLNKDSIITSGLNKDSIIGSKPKPKNQLWVGFDVEPQFQDVIIPKKDRPVLFNYLPAGGFRAGFNLTYQLGGAAALETGMQYRLWELKTFSGTYGPKTDDKINGIEIPVLITLHTHGEKVCFYSTIGFAVGVNVADRYRVQNGQDTADHTDLFTPGPNTETGFLSNLYWVGIARAGVQLDVANGMRLKIGASFNVTSSLDGNNGVNVSDLPFVTSNKVPFFPYSIGLDVAFLFKVKTKDARAKTN